MHYVPRAAGTSTKREIPCWLSAAMLWSSASPAPRSRLATTTKTPRVMALYAAHCSDDTTELTPPTHPHVGKSPATSSPTHGPPPTARRATSCPSPPLRRSPPARPTNTKHRTLPHTTQRGYATQCGNTTEVFGKDPVQQHHRRMCLRALVHTRD